MNTPRIAAFLAGMMLLSGVLSAARATDASNLSLTASIVQAGGGSDSFSTRDLIHYLADIRTASEMHTLQRDFGDANVTSFMQIFDFALSDALQRETQAGLLLPPPDPAESGETLSAKLYHQGLSDGSFSAETFFDALFGHPLHVRIGSDIDSKYDIQANRNFHAILAELMNDLKTLYSL